MAHLVVLKVDMIFNFILVYFRDVQVPSDYLAPHRGRARYCNAHVCLCVCLFVRVFAKFQSVISQPFLNRSR